jgi:hypothetical protein
MKQKIIITTGVIAVAGGLATALLMPSCEPACEIDENPSVIVSVVDEAAAGDTVTYVKADEVWYEYKNEDGELVREQATCANDDCSEWTAGGGEPGSYAIYAKVCGEEYKTSVTLEFNEEGCTDTQMVDIAVSTVDCPDFEVQPPEPPRPTVAEWNPLQWKVSIEPYCTLEARFSTVVALWAEIDGRMIPISADRAYYVVDPSGDQGDTGKGEGHEKGIGKGHEKAKGKGHHKGDIHDEELPGLCLDHECTRFAAGVEQDGTILVGAEACGQVVEATVEVPMTEDGCHVETQNVILNFDSARGTECEAKLDWQANPPRPQCEAGVMSPSAYLWPIKTVGDMVITIPTDELRYFVGEPEEVGDPAWCVYHHENGKCGLWITGWGQTGRFTAYTKKCGIDTVVNYTVEATEDGCDAETEFVMVDVDTHGCIRPPLGPGEGEGGPGTPAAGTDVKAGDPPTPPPVR